MSGTGNDSSFAFLRALQKMLANHTRPLVTIDGVVTVVNDNFTCDITVQDVTYSNVPVKVLIGSQGSIYEVPAVGTACLVKWRDNNRGLPQIDSFDKVDKYYIQPISELYFTAPKIQFNTGENGGLPITPNLVERLNLLEQAFNTHVHLGVTTGIGISGISSTQVTKTTAEEIQNDNITQ